MLDFAQQRLDSILRFVVFVVFFGFVGYGFAAALIGLEHDTDFSVSSLMGDGSLFLVSIGLAATALAEAIGFEHDQRGKLAIISASLVIVTVAPFGFAVAQIFNGDEHAAAVRSALATHEALIEQVASPTPRGNSPDTPGLSESLTLAELEQLNADLVDANQQMAAALRPAVDNQAWIFAASSAIVTLMALLCAFTTWMMKPE